MNKFEWDKERLLESYYSEESNNGGEAEQPREASKETAAPIGGTDTCQICWSKTEGSELTGIVCGHLFCKDWWDS